MSFADNASLIRDTGALDPGNGLPPGTYVNSDHFAVNQNYEKLCYPDAPVRRQLCGRVQN